MGIKKRWSRFTQENVNKVPEEPGAYQLGYSYRGKKTSYIGSSSNLRRRLSDHLRNPDKSKYPYFRYIVAGFFEDPKDLETELVEKYEEAHRQRPKEVKRAPKRRSLFGF